MPEPKLTYTQLDRSAHKAFLIESPSLERLYINSALALTDQLVKLELIQDHVKRTIAAESDTRLELMVLWLNQIIVAFELDNFLSRRIVFSQFDGKTINATCFGQHYSAIQHGHVDKLKQLTNAQLEVGTCPEPQQGFYAKVTTLPQVH